MANSDQETPKENLHKELCEKPFYHDNVKPQGSERLWNDLPADLVGCISSRLLAGDFVAFQAVCKTWHAFAVPAKLILQYSPLSLENNIPCLMFNKYPDGTKIHNPICNSTLGMEIQDFPPVDGSTIRSSNYSWLLLSNPDEGIFFFNPFTGDKVALPPLLIGGYPVYCFSFSAPPTSPDCTVFCISEKFKTNLTCCILKRGESEWTILEFDKIDDFEASSCNSLLYKGNYYCLSNEGDLLIYDFEKGEPRLINSATSFLQNRLFTHRHSQSFMVESDNGELLAVFMSCDGAWMQVCKLDESKMIWVPVHNLGEKSLFISNAGTFVETMSIRGTENKVYIPWFRGDDKGLFYSLATRKYHSFATSGSYTNLYESWRPSSITYWIKPISDSTCNSSSFTW